MLLICNDNYLSDTLCRKTYLSTQKKGESYDCLESKATTEESR